MSSRPMMTAADAIFIIFGLPELISENKESIHLILSYIRNKGAKSKPLFADGGVPTPDWSLNSPY
jgi:hypothetical protein